MNAADALDAAFGLYRANFASYAAASALLNLLGSIALIAYVYIFGYFIYPAITGLTDNDIISGAFAIGGAAALACFLTLAYSMVIRAVIICMTKRFITGETAGIPKTLPKTLLLAVIYALIFTAASIILFGVFFGVFGFWNTVGQFTPFITGGAITGAGIARVIYIVLAAAVIYVIFSLFTYGAPSAAFTRGNFSADFLDGFKNAAADCGKNIVIFAFWRILRLCLLAAVVYLLSVLIKTPQVAANQQASYNVFYASFRIIAATVLLSPFAPFGAILQTVLYLKSRSKKTGYDIALECEKLTKGLKYENEQ